MRQYRVNPLPGHSLDAGFDTGIRAYLRFRPVTADVTGVERDLFYKDTALVWVRADPGRAAGLYVLKLVNCFGFRNVVPAEPENPGVAGQVVLFVSSFALCLS